MRDSAPFRGDWGYAPPPGNFWLLGSLTLAIWVNLGSKNRNYISSMTRSCSLQKLLAELGVNVILVSTLAKHCSYIYNLDSYGFKIGTLSSPRGGQKVFKGG